MNLVNTSFIVTSVILTLGLTTGSFALIVVGFITGGLSYGGVLMLATGLRIANIKSFPIADMLPAMVLVMPVSALWTKVAGLML